MNRQQRIGDIDVAWTELGSGRPVVFIHGLAESRHTWAAQQHAITNHTTYAVDLRGHGDTTVGQGEGTAEQLSSDLISFLTTVTGPAVCVGFSLGGTVVLGAAAERPDLVRRAIVLGTSSIVGRAAAEFFRSRIAMIEHGIDDEFATALRADTAGAIARTDIDVDEVTAARLRAVGAGAGYVNAARAMTRVNEFPLTPTIERITVPVEVIGGELDTFCPRKAADILMAGLRTARYWEIPGVGHLMNVDNPDQVTHMVATLLEEDAR